MQTLSERFDEHLLDLCWSLWTELGVAGTKRHHQQYVVAPEELVLMTAVLAEIDPRLRDEALDWCSRHYGFISVSRLKALANDFGKVVLQPLSLFSATLNSVSQAHWPVLIKTAPAKFKPSGKSKMPQLELPALLYLRLRKLFGVGARADIIAFFLEQKRTDFSALDFVETGYSKRNIAEVLDGLTQAGIVSVTMMRNQQRYSLVKRAEIVRLLGKFPQFTPAWRHLFPLLLTLRETIFRTEKSSESTKAIEIHKTLQELKGKLNTLNLSPPIFQTDFSAFWNSFSKWLLETVQSI